MTAVEEMINTVLNWFKRSPQGDLEGFEPPTRAGVIFVGGPELERIDIDDRLKGRWVQSFEMPQGPVVVSAVPQPDH